MHIESHTNERMIRYLNRKQIDDDKWNSVITASRYETIYPHTWYLDACADSWTGLVMNDYECIMPVVFRNKFGLRYTYQPVYCQQLGVFSEKRVDTEITRMFLHKLQRKFRMGDYALNEGNIIGEEKGLNVTDSHNYTLPLAETYDHIFKNYSENCRRNVKKAFREDIEFTDDVKLEEVISLKKMNEKVQRQQKHYMYVRLLFEKLAAMERVRVFGARIGSHLLAAAVFGYCDRRTVFLLSASSDMGKEKRAMFMLMDSFIQMHSESGYTLDFEGSDIASVARFFRGFGAKPQVYQRISFNNRTNNLIKKLRSA